MPKKFEYWNLPKNKKYPVLKNFTSFLVTHIECNDNKVTEPCEKSNKNEKELQWNINFSKIHGVLHCNQLKIAHVVLGFMEQKNPVEICEED